MQNKIKPAFFQSFFSIFNFYDQSPKYKYNNELTEYLLSSANDLSTAYKKLKEQYENL
ncbi:MAG: hypothetical protein HRU35_04230 [Rickettsiaceae bacterium]|nr:hypothetical protein [Rickettsiaceae bacterium]